MIPPYVSIYLVSQKKLIVLSKKYNGGGLWQIIQNTEEAQLQNKSSRLTTLRVSNEAENWEPQPKNKRGIKTLFIEQGMTLIMNKKIVVIVKNSLSVIRNIFNALTIWVSTVLGEICIFCAI
jgi:hypothetical protein